ncbi:MAG: pyridoxal-phosphate dependent enzyme, partial [Kofleriaceae bacterium]|nr:pyridoxal-phosphate dependent enzyme [Kofleriaceae bacterium]
MTLQVPNRVSLAITPTPLQYLERTSAALGVEFYIKRDDMTGLELSGNKVRKLEFLFADAIEKGANVVITGGGEQSNHCRATAMAAAKLGLASVVCLRTLDKENPPKTSGNILLDRLAGAEIVWIDHDDWARQEEVYEREAARQRELGNIPYIIPEGGSNAIGAWGYIECCRELAEQMGALKPGQNSGRKSVETSIVYACGSGGTGAGLVLGAKMYDFDKHQAKVTGFNVCDDAEFFVQRIHRICEEVVAA